MAEVSARSGLRTEGRRLALGACLALLGRALQEWPAFVEWHRSNLAPFWAAIQQPVAGLFSGTIGEALAVLVVAGAIAGVVRARGRGLGSVFICAGALILAFYVIWGVAYRYPDLGSRLAPLPVDEMRPQRERIEALALRAALLVSQAASESAASRDASLSSISAALREGYEALPERLEVSPVHARVFSSAKVSRVSFALSRLQLSGYYFPWTGEAQINGEMPVSLWPRVAAHELAHQRGFARENEATVVGLLACLASKDPFVRYGGSLGLFASLDRELRRLDPSAREAVWARLPRVAVGDFEREAAFWKRFDGPAATVSEKVNDRYLKTQGVRSGVQSYGETTRLLLQAAATPGIRIPWPVVQSP